MSTLMVAIAALALLGLHTPAEDPWFTKLMGVAPSAATTDFKKGEEGNYWTSKDGLLLVDVQGDPTSIVWAMLAEDDSNEEFSITALLKLLGFDTQNFESTPWKRPGVTTPVVKTLPGLKEGWLTFVGAYDVLFVGPSLAGDFDQDRPALQPADLTKGFAAFSADPSWKGAIEAYGKARHMELMDHGYYVLAWKSEGPIAEVSLNFDFSTEEGATKPLTALRANADLTGELIFTFNPGTKEWQSAFEAAGLDPAGVTVKEDEIEKNLVIFSNVKGVSKSFVVYAELDNGSINTLNLVNMGEDQPRR